MVDEGHRLSRLVENLLDVSRLESGAAEPHREPVELAEVLEAARRSIGAGAEQVRLRARRGPAGAQRRPGPARARLRQPARERASSTAAASRSWSARGWSGRGWWCGWSTAAPASRAGERERIFEPFYRAPDGDGQRLRASAWRSPSGFVEANGGEIEVESLPGQGTSFVVSFGTGRGAEVPA